MVLCVFLPPKGLQRHRGIVSTSDAAYVCTPIFNVFNPSHHSSFKKLFIKYISSIKGRVKSHSARIKAVVPHGSSSTAASSTASSGSQQPEPSSSPSAEERVDLLLNLATILPGNESTVQKLTSEQALQLAGSFHDLPYKMIALREVLPRDIDASALIARWPKVLFLTPNEVETGIKRVQSAFEECLLDGEGGTRSLASILQHSPQLLEQETLMRTLRGAMSLAVSRRELVEELRVQRDGYKAYHSLNLPLDEEHVGGPSEESLRLDDDDSVPYWVHMGYKWRKELILRKHSEGTPGGVK
jgi:hypothetical protein